MSNPKWMPVALSYLGTEEVGGKGTNPVIKKFFEEAGHPEITDDETPWCSAFVNAVFFECGIKGTQSLAARSWLDWGTGISEPEYGDVCVIRRGNSSWQGHVFFFVRFEGDYIVGLGGNQGDEVSVAKFPKDALLGFRRPKTLGTSRTVKAATLSASAQGAVEVIDAIQKVTESASSLPLSIAKYALFISAILGLGLVIYFKWDDIRMKASSLHNKKAAAQ